MACQIRSRKPFQKQNKTAKCSSWLYSSSFGCKTNPILLQVRLQLFVRPWGWGKGGGANVLIVSFHTVRNAGLCLWYIFHFPGRWTPWQVEHSPYANSQRCQGHKMHPAPHSMAAGLSQLRQENKLGNQMNQGLKPTNFDTKLVYPWEN